MQSQHQRTAEAIAQLRFVAFANAQNVAFWASLELKASNLTTAAASECQSLGYPIVHNPRTDELSLTDALAEIERQHTSPTLSPSVRAVHLNHIVYCCEQIMGLCLEEIHG